MTAPAAAPAPAPAPAAAPAGAAFPERVALLEAHRDRVREQIPAQQAGPALLDSKIDNYRRTLRGPGEGE